jgi:nitrogen-specific signal transduction histidine kinase/ActR/RegA family two-component response regulator
MSDLVRDPATSVPVKMVGTVQDITAIKRTEEALRQAQKMEAIGQLTGGIAHDFNNLMTVVGGNLELLEEGLASNEPRLKDFARIAHDAVLRGGNLTQRLLAFARRQNLQPEETDLNDLVVNLVPLLHRALGEQIAVETALGTDVWKTLCDASQLENALLNLAVNARDAMASGGRLTIRTENASLDRAWAAESADWQEGDYVMVAVSDTGEGMPPDIQDKVFEPFFTTKGAGKGTGLGLSMVYGFVKQSGGHIKVYSEVGQGTTVKLFLPRAQASETLDREPEPEAAIPRGTESVLLVEDDDMVRATAATMLGDLGYRVTEASDGRSALALIESRPPFDLILTDVVMPGGMTGWDLAQAIWKNQPDSKVLFSTGYTDNPIFRNARHDHRIHVLPKPYSKRAIAVKLREIIDRAGGSVQ